MSAVAAYHQSVTRDVPTRVVHGFIIRFVGRRLTRWWSKRSLWSPRHLPARLDEVPYVLPPGNIVGAGPISVGQEVDSNFWTKNARARSNAFISIVCNFEQPRDERRYNLLPDMGNYTTHGCLFLRSGKPFLVPAKPKTPFEWPPECPWPFLESMDWGCECRTFGESQ
jgi:hypothetical protein